MTTSGTRERLLDATARLVARRGYQGTGVNAVLAASGSPNGSLYHHFPHGKDELIAASMTRTGEQTAVLLAAAMANGPAAGVRLIFDYLADRVADEDFRAGCRIATPLADVGDDADEVRAAAAAAFTAWVVAISDGLTAAGWKTRPARALAEQTICLFEGALVLCRAEGSVRPLRVARDAALVLLEAAAPASPAPNRRGR